MSYDDFHDDPLRRLLDKLDGVRRSGNGYAARCPAHDDRSPSLTIATGDGGRVLVRCMAGCDTADVLAAVGLAVADLFPDDPRRPTPRGRFGRFAEAAKRTGRASPLNRPAEPPPDAPPDPRHAALAEAAWRAGRPRLRGLAGEMGVSAASLDALRVGYATAAGLRENDTGCRGAGAWTWPMRDGGGRVVGVRLRGHDAGKWSVTGGRQGLFAAAATPDAGGVLFVAEGASDAAALLTLNLWGVGLPSAGQGGPLVLDYARRHRPARVLVLADADAAGRKGGDAVARVLAAGGIGCRVANVPGGAKDARDFLNNGGDADALLRLLDGPAEGTVTL